MNSQANSRMSHCIIAAAVMLGISVALLSHSAVEKDHTVLRMRKRTPYGVTMLTWFGVMVW